MIWVVALLVTCAIALLLAAEVQRMRKALCADRARLVREAQNAKLAAAIVSFEDLNAYSAQVLSRVYDDGLMPDRRRAPRGKT